MCNKKGDHLVGTLALLLALLAALIRGALAGTTGNLGGDLEEDLAKSSKVAPRLRHHGGIVGRSLAILEKVHDDSAATVSSSMLSQVIASGELLATLVALKGLLLGVERAVVSLEVFLTAESSVAEVTNEGLGRVLSERLLAATAVGGGGQGSRASLRARGSTRVLLGIGGSLGSLLVLTRLSVGSSVHDGGNSVVLLVVALLHTLVLVAVLAASGGGAGQGRELEGVVLVEREIFVSNEATVAERHNRGTSAGTGSANINGLLTSKVDKAVDKVVLRLKVGKLLKGGEAAGQRGVEVEGLGAGSLNLLNLDLVLAQSGQGKLGGQGGVASRDSEVPGIAEVDVTIRRRDGSRIGDRRGRQRRARCGGQEVAGGSTKRRDLAKLRFQVHCQIQVSPLNPTNGWVVKVR